MKKPITYPIKVIKDVREDLREIIGKNINCCISFDKWNNLLLIEVFKENEKTR